MCWWSSLWTGLRPSNNNSKSQKLQSGRSLRCAVISSNQEWRPCDWYHYHPIAANQYAGSSTCVISGVLWLNVERQMRASATWRTGNGRIGRLYMRPSLSHHDNTAKEFDLLASPPCSIWIYVIRPLRISCDIHNAGLPLSPPERRLLPSPQLAVALCLRTWHCFGPP